MELKTFFYNFETMAEAPNGVQKLREMILQLAVQGKLVPQDPNDEPASVLLEKIRSERERLIKTGKVKRSNPLPLINLDEMPFALPDSWAWERLGKICAYIQRGKGPKYSDISDVPVISQKCIQWDGFRIERARFVDPSILGTYDEERFLLTGDLLWNSTGTGTIGRVNIYCHEANKFDKVVADSHVTVVRPIGLNSRYIYIFLASPTVQYGFEDKASGTTNQIELNLSAVNNQIIPIPPLAEQKRIVAKVDELMALCDDLEARKQKTRQTCIQLNDACIDKMLAARELARFNKHWQRILTNFDLLYSQPENVNKLRQAILQLAVQGKLVPQDPNDEPTSVLLEKIRAEKGTFAQDGGGEKGLDELPKGWAWVTMADVSDSRLGKMLDKGKNRGKPHSYLRNTNVQWLRFDLSDVKKMRFEDHELLEYEIKYGDLLVCEGGEPGRCAVWDRKEQKMMFQKAIHRVRPYSGIEVWFLLYRLLHSCMSGELNAYFTGATIKHLTGRQLARFSFGLPPTNEQKRIVAKVDQLMALCDDLEAKLQKSQKRNDRLMEAAVAEMLVV